MAEQDIYNDPSICSSAYHTMVDEWDKIDTLLGGTRAMRAAQTKYTPQHERESDERYHERIQNATLLNMVEITLNGWVSKPFDLPLKAGDDVPVEIKPYLKNIDLQGNSLDIFARAWFRDGLAKGFSHVLVEFPRIVPNEDGTPRTRADDQRENLRPYLVHVRPENLIFASCEMINGVEVLTHVRIREMHRQRVGFGEVITERIRVIEPGVVTIYEPRKDPKNNDIIRWVVVDYYRYDLPYIPLVTFYATKNGFMLAKPPLSDLADLNIRHFNSTSDQISVLTVARFPIVCVRGALPDGNNLVLGPYNFLYSPSADGGFSYLEHSGQAIGAGRNELQDLESTMAQFGATFLRNRPGGASATARALDSAEVSSPLSDMAIKFQDAITQAMLIFANWLGLDDGGTYTVTTNFGLDDETGQKLTALTNARTNGDLSHAQFITELGRYNVLSTDFDSEANDDELAKEKAEKQKLFEQQAALKKQNNPGNSSPPNEPDGNQAE